MRPLLPLAATVVAVGHFEYVIQGKTLLRPLRTDGWGAGLVFGTGRDPALAGLNPDVRSYYAYVPLSLSLAADRVVLHQNTGWLYQRAGGAAGAASEFQLGLRAFPRPNSVQVDLRWGGFVRGGGRAAGWTIGLTLATPPFL